MHFVTFAHAERYFHAENGRFNSLTQRKIQALWKAGYSQQKIADEIGVHKSTISRELNRNITFVRTRLGYWDYKADYAQSFAEQRKKTKPTDQENH